MKNERNNHIESYYHYHEKETREQKIDSLLSRGVNEVIGNHEIKQRLLRGENLRVKFGTDPTSPNIHTGRMVPILKLRDFQELGCTPVIVIGDFTGEIGDTSDKTAERPMIDQNVVRNNMKTYINQIGKIIDIKKSEVYYNSQWLSKLDFNSLARLADKFSVAEFISRTNIKSRLDRGKRVSLREMLYPLMQGYDSVFLNIDVELGGDDQRFNLLAGRQLQKALNKPQQNILMTNLIPGLDGRKMSSSWGNTINISDSPKEMYGKIMSMKDELIIDTFIHCTRVPMEQVNEYQRMLTKNTINPMEIKHKLAYTLTDQIHGENLAMVASNNFRDVIQNKNIPEKIPMFTANSNNIVDILVGSGLCSSKSEARRVIDQKGIRVNGEIISSYNQVINQNTTINKGKKDYIKVIYG